MYPTGKKSKRYVLEICLLRKMYDIGRRERILELNEYDGNYD